MSAQKDGYRDGWEKRREWEYIKDRRTMFLDMGPKDGHSAANMFIASDAEPGYRTGFINGWDGWTTPRKDS